MLDALQFQFLLLFEGDRCQHAVPNVFALRVVEELDVVEHVVAGFFAGSILSAADGLVIDLRTDGIAGVMRDLMTPRRLEAAE